MTLELNANRLPQGVSHVGSASGPDPDGQVNHITPAIGQTVRGHHQRSDLHYSKTVRDSRRSRNLQSPQLTTTKPNRKSSRIAAVTASGP
jgi:hypothetical protein